MWVLPGPGFQADKELLGSEVAGASMVFWNNLESKETGSL